jgi:hypothetical protein
MAYLAPESIVLSVPSTLTCCQQNVFFVVSLVTHEQHFMVGASDED